MKKIITSAIAGVIAIAAAGQSAISTGATAPRARVLTLEECRELALRNNAKVKIAEGNAEAATQTRREAFTKYFPTVTARGDGFWSNRHVIDYDILDLATLKMIKRGIGASVTAVQPVFAGGQIVNGNRLASVGESAAKLERQASVDDVIITVEQYYWQLVTYKEKKKTLESVISLVDTIASQVGTALKAGIVTRNDLLKVELRKNDLKATMVDLDNGISLCQMVLGQYVGPDGTPVDVAAPELGDDVPPYPADIYVAPQEALRSTVDYQLLDRQVEAARLKERMEVGKNLPTVGVGAGYFYDDILSQSNHFGAVFVSVNIPISGWWGGSHAIKKTRAERRNAETRRTDLSQMLEINMQNAWDDLTAAHRKMEIAKESIGQSTENLRMNQAFYDAGTTTITDLLDAQTLYRQSRDQFIEAYGNFQVKRAQYLDATGRAQQLVEPR